jgi:hypothetical protein
MKRLYLLSTLLFWLATALFAWQGRTSAPQPVPLSPTVSTPVVSAPVVSASGVPGAERRFALAEVARHARPDDCWMAIDGSVYDFTAYLPRHPSEPAVIEAWCGREASEAYRTKTRGQPHSAAATRRMADYRLGTLDPPPR